MHYVSTKSNASGVPGRHSTRNRDASPRDSDEDARAGAPTPASPASPPSHQRHHPDGPDARPGGVSGLSFGFEFGFGFGALGRIAP